MKILKSALVVGLLVAFCAVAADAETCCQGKVGDANGDGGEEPTIGDISWIILLLYVHDGCFPLDWPDGYCLPEADVDQSGGCDPVLKDDITISDASILVDYLYVGGPYDPVFNPEGVQLNACLPCGEPYGYLVSTGDCTNMGGALSDIVGGESVSCVRYTYDGEGTLDLTHVNAVLNCCPILNMTISVEADTITIVETPDGVCDCTCPFDIDYRVEDLPPGQYRIVVYEAYPNANGPIDFTVDLSYAHSGEYCEEPETAASLKR